MYTVCGTCWSCVNQTDALGVRSSLSRPGKVTNTAWGRGMYAQWLLFMQHFFMFIFVACVSLLGCVLRGVLIRPLVCWWPAPVWYPGQILCRKLSGWGESQAFMSLCSVTVTEPSRPCSFSPTFWQLACLPLSWKYIKEVLHIYI